MDLQKHEPTHGLDKTDVLIWTLRTYKETLLGINQADELSSLLSIIEKLLVFNGLKQVTFLPHFKTLQQISRLLQDPIPGDPAIDPALESSTGNLEFCIKKTRNELDQIISILEFSVSPN